MEVSPCVTAQHFSRLVCLTSQSTPVHTPLQLAFESLVEMFIINFIIINVYVIKFDAACIIYIYHLVHYIEPLGGVSNNSRARNLLSAFKVDPMLFELTFIQNSH